jgi:hypothetical protein
VNHTFSDSTLTFAHVGLALLGPTLLLGACDMSRSGSASDADPTPPFGEDGGTGPIDSSVRAPDDPPPIDTPVDGCTVAAAELIEDSAGGCHRASIALGAEDRPHVGWSGRDGNGWVTDGGYARRDDAGWVSQRPFGPVRHLSLDVDGDRAFLLTVDEDARPVLWAGDALAPVAAFDDRYRRGPSGDGLLVRDGFVDVLVGPIQFRNSAGGEGVDHFRAPLSSDGTVGAFALVQLSRSVGSWPDSIAPAPDGEPRALFRSGDGSNYIQPVLIGERERVSWEVTGPSFTSAIGGSLLVTPDGTAHTLGVGFLDGRPGGTDYVLSTQQPGEWSHASVVEARRFECPSASAEGDSCAVDSERWNAHAMVSGADTPILLVSRTVETGSLTWRCEEVCGVDTCGDGGCCRGNCRWEGERSYDRALFVARVDPSGAIETVHVPVDIAEPRSIDAEAGADGAIHVVLAEQRTLAEGVDCSLRYLRLGCGFGGGS